MENLSTWRSLYTLRYCPITLIQTVFSAGTVYLLTAIQASSGTRIAQKELRHSLAQQNLVLLYLQEIGKSWQCATNIAGILKNLMHEQLLPLMERKTITIPNSGSLHVPEIDEEEAETGSSLSRSPSRGQAAAGHVRRRSSTKQSRLSHARIHSGSQSSISTPPAPVSSSPTILISPVASNHAPPPSSRVSTAPIAIQMPPTDRTSFSSSPSSYPESSSWGLRPSPAAYTAASPGSPSPGSSPAFSTNMPSPSPSASFVHRGFNGYPQAFTHVPNDDMLFSGNGNGHNGLGHAFHRHSSSSGSVSSLFGQSQEHASGSSSSPSTRLYSDKDFSGVLGMLGGQTISQAPFLGPFSLGDGTFAPLTGPIPFDRDKYKTQSSLDQSFTNSLLAQSMSSASLETTDSPLDMDATMDEFPQWEMLFGQEYGSM